MIPAEESKNSSGDVKCGGSYLTMWWDLSIRMYVNLQAERDIRDIHDEFSHHRGSEQRVLTVCTEPHDKATKQNLTARPSSNSSLSVISA